MFADWPTLYPGGMSTPAWVFSERLPCHGKWTIFTPENVAAERSGRRQLERELLALRGEAVDICVTQCEHIMMCREWALSTEPHKLRVGVMGGTTPEQRDAIYERRLRKGKRNAA